MVHPLLFIVPLFLTTLTFDTLNLKFSEAHFPLQIRNIFSTPTPINPTFHLTCPSKSFNVSAGGESTSSTQASERLSTGALVLQLELKGDRLHYQLRRLPGKRKGGWFIHRVDLRKMKEWPLKRDHFNRQIVFQPSYFKGYVSFGGVMTWEFPLFICLLFQNDAREPGECGKYTMGRRRRVART